MDPVGGDDPFGTVWGAVGSGDSSHLGAVCALAAGADPTAVEPPLELDAGQRQQSAAAERLHGLAAGRRDAALAVPGKTGRDDTSVPKKCRLPTVRVCVLSMCVFPLLRIFYTFPFRIASTCSHKRTHTGGCRMFY